MARRSTPTLDMTKHLPLRSQPASFWIGVGLVAEAPFALAALVLSPEAKLRIVDFLVSGVPGVAAAIALLVGSFFLVAWLARRAGLGE